MKRKLFDFGLHLDSLRRTALVGGLFTALMSVQSVIVVIGFLISASETKSRMLGQYTITTVGLLEINPMIFIIPLLAVPLLMFTLFGFLTKRSASDFWHSIPFSRECVYTTFILAAFSWGLAAVLISTLVSVVGFLLMPQFYAINFMSVLYILPGIIAIALLIMGAFAISASLTGTVFNTVVVTCLILFLPRAFIMYFNSLCSNSSLFPSVFENGDSSSLNLLFAAFIGSVFGTDKMNEDMTSIPAILYTLILGVAYLIVGAVLFKHRKSEAASLSAVNKYVQASLRIIVSLIVCFVPIGLICELRFDDIGDIFLIVVFYVLAVIAYLLYELITTKKAKNMLKSLPGLWVLFILNFIIIVSATVIENIEYNYTPTAESVKSVKIYDSSTDGSYFNKKMSKLSIADDELEEFLSNMYIQNRKAFNQGDLRSAGHKVITVSFQNGLTQKHRRLYLNPEAYAKMGELLDKNDDVKGIYDINNIFENAIHSKISIGIADSELTAAQHKSILDAFISDINAMPFSEWYAIANNARGMEIYYSKPDMVSNNTNTKHYYQLGNVSSSISIGGNTYYVEFPLTNQMPKAYNLTLGYLCDYQNSKGAVELLKEKMSQPDNYGVNINITLYNGIKKTASEQYPIYKDPQLNKKFIDAVSPCFGEVPDANSRIAVVSYNRLDSSKESRENINVILKVPENADLTFLIDQQYR